ncbi:MAG: CrcB family protein [Phycisphaerae bacterium]|nr:CrcB family protein [Phycisphaerae bacterium]
MLSMPEAALVFAGGALGSAVRYASLRLGTRFGMHASLALAAINLAGCVLAGAVATSFMRTGFGELDADLARALLLGGMLGGFTTFSAVSLEVAAAARGGQRRRILIETVASVVLAAPMARLGMLLAGASA